MKGKLATTLACFLGAAGVLALASCSGTGNTGTTSAAQTGLPCDVSTVLTSRCQQCHSDPPKFGAPMPLVTRAHLMAKSSADPQKTYAERALVRMRDAKSPMPQPPNAAATAAEIAALDAWVKAGMTENQAACTGGQGPNAPPPPPGKLACAPDTTLAPPAAFEMPKETEDLYVCYGVDLPSTAEKRHVVGLDARIDNPKIVHHILVFEAQETEPSAPHPCKELFPINWKLIYAWAPGTDPYNLPPEAGYPLEVGATTHYVVQIHYSNIQKLSGEKDRTGVDLCTTKQLRKYDADLVAIGGAQFSLPPKARSTRECSLPIPKSSKFPVTVFRAWPHMHQLGASLSSKVVRPDGSSASLGGIDTWNFYNQIGYPISTVVNGGDTLVTRCTWNNSTSEKVGFGEKTGDEMCYNFITYYPKTNLQTFSGVTPASLSVCKEIPE